MLYVAPLSLKYLRYRTGMRLSSSPESSAELLVIGLTTLSHARGRTSGVSVRVSVIFRMDGGGVQKPLRLCPEQVLQVLA